jgi:hypothetical protein
MAWVGVAGLILGSIAIFRRSRTHFALFVLPIAMTLCASTLGEYPFADRLVFFLVPSLLGVVGAGIDSLLGRDSMRARVIGFAAVALILGKPAYRCLWRTCRGARNPAIRPLLEGLESHVQPGDVLYARKMAGPTVHYYLRHRGLLQAQAPRLILDGFYEPPVDSDSMEQRSVPSQYISLSASELFDRTRPARTWVLVQVKHLFVEKPGDDEFIGECMAFATRSEVFKDSGVGAFSFVPKP